jgi:hypothetical protein
MEVKKNTGKDTEYWFLKKWLTVKETNEQIVKSSLNHLQIIYQIIVYVYTSFRLCFMAFR